MASQLGSSNRISACAFGLIGNTDKALTEACEPVSIGAQAMRSIDNSEFHIKKGSFSLIYAYFPFSMQLLQA